MQDTMSTEQEQQETAPQQGFTSINDIFPDYDKLRSAYADIYDEHRSVIGSNDSVKEYWETLLWWLP
jgi:hypothetical protein